jgi:GNAT superfamily N-acetyltransferase
LKRDDVVREATAVSPQDVLPLRTRQREEMACQIVHDSIHRRDGWSVTHSLRIAGDTVGFASVAVGGPWKGKPTLYELYLLPEHRGEAFGLFDALLAASGARFFEVQTNDPLITLLVHAYGHELESEKLVFRDGADADLPANGARVRCVTSDRDLRAAIEARQGGGDWILEVDGRPAGKGGVLFHYNRPYADVFMEIARPFRRRGFGAYFVQELKRACYALGAVPAARCRTTNVASRRTIMRAGFVPCGHIIKGSLQSGSRLRAKAGLPARARRKP